MLLKFFTGLLLLCSLTAAAPIGTASVTAVAEAVSQRAYPPVSNLSERLLRDFDLVDGGYSSGHRGIDIQAETGETIRSPISGWVHFAGFVVNRSVISVIGPDGDLYAFEPACSELNKGDQVSAREVIGKVCAGSGNYQHCAQSCLHISLRAAGEYLSPLPRFGVLRPSRLYPMSHLSELGQALG